MKYGGLIGVSTGGVLAGLGAVWGVMALPVPAEMPEVTPRGRVYEPAPRPAPPLPGRVWEAPDSQSSGPDWVFEVFTPPIIFFHESANRFTLTPPLARAPEAPWGAVLAGLERPLYRLQYRFHVGEGARVRVEFLEMETNRWYRLRLGEAAPAAGFRLESFRAERVMITPDIERATPYPETAVEAVIFDQRLGKRVTLTSAPKFQDAAVALMGARPDRLAVVAVGETVDLHDFTYRLEDLEPELARATVTRLAKANFPAETRHLPVTPIRDHPGSPPAIPR